MNFQQIQLKMEGKIDTALTALKSYADMRKVTKGSRYRNQYELPASIRKYADFAAGSYDSEKKEIRGYKLDDSLSTDQFRVFKKGDKIVFAIRGSSTEAKFNDFIVNDTMGIGMGKEHLQLKQARTKLQEIKDKFPNASLTLTGHSLGSLSASALGAENGIKTIGFNAGSSPLGGKEYQSFLHDTFSSPYVTSVVAEGDLVSASAIKHIPADQLHVITNPGHKIGKTVDRHLMHNFQQNEHIKNIKNTLDEQGVANASNIIHKLHQSGKSDESLKKRAANLKTSLKGGTDIALNEGEYLASGGWHTMFQAKGNTMDLNGEQVPKAGAKLYVNSKKGMMYFFDANHKPHILHGDMRDMGEQFKKANMYNRGPSLIVNDQNPNEQVALVAAHGAQGFDVVPATSKKDWKYVLGGNSAHGSGGGWWSGKKSKWGYVGNAAVNLFLEKPFSTFDDGEAAALDSFGEGLFHMAIPLMEMGATVATGGTAGAVITAVTTVMDATGASDFLQEQLDKLLPDTRHESLATIENVFKSAKTFDGRKPFSDTSEELMVDERIPFRIKNLEKDWDEIRDKGRKISLTSEEDQDMYKLHPSKVTNEDTQAEQKKMLDLLEPKYLYMKHAFNATGKLEELDKKASKAGLGSWTTHNYSEMRKTMIPSEKGKLSLTRFPSKFQDINQFTDIVKNTTDSLNNSVEEHLKNAPKMYQQQFDKQLGWNKGFRDPFLEKIAKKEEFEKLYKGDESKKESEFKKYKKELFTAYQAKQVGYSGFDVSKLHEDDQFFTKRYLKKHEQAKSTYIAQDYFNERPEEFTHFVDIEHETQKKLVADALKNIQNVEPGKAKVIP